MSHWKNVLLRLPPPPTLLPPAVGREEEDDCTGGSKRNSIATSFHLSPSSIHLPLFLPPDGSRFRRPALAHLDSSAATLRKPRGNQPSSSWLLGGALCPCLFGCCCCCSCFGFRETTSAQRIGLPPFVLGARRREGWRLRSKGTRIVVLFAMGNCLGGSPAYVNKVSSTAKPGEFQFLCRFLPCFSLHPSTCPYPLIELCACVLPPIP